MEEFSNKNIDLSKEREDFDLASKKLKESLLKISKNESEIAKKEIFEIVKTLKEDIEKDERSNIFSIVPEKYLSAPEIVEIAEGEFVKALKYKFGNDDFVAEKVLNMTEYFPYSKDFIMSEKVQVLIKDRFESIFNAEYSYAGILAEKIAKKFSFSREYIFNFKEKAKVFFKNILVGARDLNKINEAIEFGEYFGLNKVDMEILAKEYFPEIVRYLNILLITDFIKKFNLNDDFLSSEKAQMASLEILGRELSSNDFEEAIKIIEILKINKDNVKVGVLKKAEYLIRFAEFERVIELSNIFKINKDELNVLIAKDIKYLLKNERVGKVLDRIKELEVFGFDKAFFDEVIKESFEDLIKNKEVGLAVLIKNKIGFSEEYLNSDKIRILLTESFEGGLRETPPNLDNCLKIHVYFKQFESAYDRLINQDDIKESVKREIAHLLNSGNKETAYNLVKKFSLPSEILNTEKPSNEGERNLIEGKKQAAKNLGGGCNQTIFVDIVDDGSGVFKPIDGEVEIREKIKRGTYYRRERSAYIIDRFMDLGLVPPTVIKEIDGKIGSIQEFIPDSKTGFESLKELEKEEIKNQLKKLWLFDYLIFNADRHEGNFLIANGRVYAIDNGLCFGEDRLRITGSFLEQDLPEDFVEKIIDLSRDSVRQKILREFLEELLFKNEVEAFFLRLNRMAKILIENKNKIPSKYSQEIARFK